jgi:hypothetical protein
MFCTNCGKQVQETSKFCPYCGMKIGSVEQTIETAYYDRRPVQIEATSVIENLDSKLKFIKPLRILSIIGIIWFPLCFVSFSNVSMIEQVISFTIFAFGYAIAHSIVALVQGLKYDLKPLKIMGILGIVWYAISSICIIAFAQEDYETYIGWVFLGLGYAVAFAIVALIKSKIKT